MNESTHGYIMVLTNPVPGTEEPFNEHYDQFHLAEVTSVPGIVSGQRYERQAVDIGENRSGAHQYMALYETNEDPATVVQRVYQRFVDGGFQPIPEIDTDMVSMVWAPIGPKRLHDEVVAQSEASSVGAQSEAS